MDYDDIRNEFYNKKTSTTHKILMDKTPQNKILHKIRAKAIEQNKEETKAHKKRVIENSLNDVKLSDYYAGSALSPGNQSFANAGGATSNYTGTFTVPNSVYRLQISMSGGGGGGGGNTGPGCGSVSHNSGSGGGGAGYFIGIVSVTPGQTISFSLGYGGAGGTSRNNSGTFADRKSTRLNSSHEWISRMPSSA